jgi:UDP-glucose 4-epimerase
MRILVTGGAGYIGSHTVVELMAAGHDVSVLDNFSNSRADVIGRVEKIAGRKFFAVIHGDIRNRDDIDSALEGCDAVIHFAALKSVGESVANPDLYHDNNVEGTRNLLEAMKLCGLKKLVFSSSAAVYGTPESLPIAEDHPLSAANPYGETKIICEKMMHDFYKNDPSWRFALLRYFNPVGAHDSGLIGESPEGTPSNLTPYIAQVATGKFPHVNVYGDDYDTPDGTGVRDYIHVMDLAAGHVAALNKLISTAGIFTVNLGTGRGHSVLDLVRVYEDVTGKNIPTKIMPRRAGDVAVCYADVTLAKKVLGWTAARDLKEMCASSWRWTQGHI